LSAFVGPRGQALFSSAVGRVSFSLIGVGSSPRTTPIEDRAVLWAHGNRVTYSSRADMAEWLAAGPLGIEQGFVVKHRPESGPRRDLVIALRIGGQMRAQMLGRQLIFDHSLTLGGLAAVDRSGKGLPASMQLRGRVLSLNIDDRGARYPIRIDPLFQNSVQLVADCISLNCGGPQGIGERGGAWAGYSVALSADSQTALVGAPLNGGGLGAVWVFSLVNGIWAQQVQLEGTCQGSCNALGGTLPGGVLPVGTGELGNGEFGWSVALSDDGNTAIIGAPRDNANVSSDPTNPAYFPYGAAWIFTRSNGSWSQQGTKLIGYCSSSCGGANGTGEMGPGDFGWSVALSAGGDQALIGAPHNSGGEGAVWAFGRSAGAWSQNAELMGDCTQSCNGAAGTGESGHASFGWSVALSADGTKALVGAPVDAGESGAAWLFSQSSGSWAQLGPKLVGDCSTGCSGPLGSGEAGPAMFGYSVAVSSDASSALIGAPQDNGSAGAAWLFTSQAGSWTSSTKFVGDCPGGCFGPNGTGEAGGGSFGYSVALSSDGATAFIGAPDDNGSAGAAWLFTDVGGGWSQVDRAGGDCRGGCTGASGAGEIGSGSFGDSVALDGGGRSALAGAPTDNFEAGSAWSVAATPSATAAPVVTGTAAVGSTLSCTSGTWSGQPTGYDYQWDSAGSTVSGANSSAYVVQSSDAGNTVTCLVQAFNKLGAGPAATSNGVPIPSSTPANTSAPTILGSSGVGSSLSCLSGSWTNNPYDYMYQWSRNGVPIPGATNYNYTISPLDEGSRLTCTVIAVGLTDKSRPATTAALKVRIPHIAGCPPATGSLKGVRLGLASLGATPSEVRKAYARSKDARSADTDTFCLTPYGVTVGYPTAALLKTLSHSAGNSLKGTVVWITTGNPRYSIEGVRAGVPLSVAIKRLALGRPLKAGKRLWYVAAGGGTQYLVRAPGGVVQEIGIAVPAAAAPASRAVLISLLL
jgi:hypothetical protein